MGGLPTSLAHRPQPLRRLLERCVADLSHSAACGLGRVITSLDRVRLFWSTTPTRRSPSIAEEGIVILLSGRKVGYLGERRFVYDRDHCLVVSASLPYEYSAQASEDDPLIGLFIKLDLVELRELVLAIETHDPGLLNNASQAPGLTTVPLKGPIRDVVRRLLGCIGSPRDMEVLGPSLVRELTYRVAVSPEGGGLRALTYLDTNQARIARVLVTIKQDVSARYSVDSLARETAMSPTTFYRAFRKFTGESPISYIKKLRLHSAGASIVYDGMSVREAAEQVGYHSSSQFSREFKRLFGHTPSSLRSVRKRGKHRYNPMEIT